MKKIIIILLVLAYAWSAQSQIYNPVTWSFDSKHLSGDKFELIYTAKIDDGWTIYSQYLESEDGPVATTFEFDEGDHFSTNGKNNEDKLNRKEGFDKIFQMNVTKYTKKAIFRQKVKVKDYAKPITGYLTFMTCDASKCLPPKDIDFEFKLEPASNPAEKALTNQVVASKKNVPAQASKPKKAETITAKSMKQEAKQIEKELVKEAKQNEKETLANLSSEPIKAKSGYLEPVTWGINVKKVDQDYVVVYTANIDKGWTIYSQHTSDDGPVPTSFNFDEANTYTLNGAVQEEGKKKEGYDKLFDTNVIKFVKGPVTFTQKIKASDASNPITGYLTFMTCDDSRCLPPTDVDFVIFPNKLSGLLGNKASTIIATMTAATTNNAGVDSEATNAAGGNTFAGINLDGNIIDQIRPVIRETFIAPIGKCGEENAASNSLIWTFIFGFLGGLVALLTPCVFPMIPLTVSYFTKGSTDKASGIKNGLIYGASIIVIYLAIGLIITGVFGPTALNELSTNWIANVIFFVIFVFFAFSFFGFYEITLPSSWSNKSDTMADKGGLIGTFFMAFTLALVSFSCTGPIIGSALVASATDVWGPFVVMLGFSSALALPFGLFAAFPAMLNTLPSSGSWMNSVKVVLGFLELALAFKFLSVADMTMHWGILKYELFLGLWILFFLGITLYLFGLIKFPHDSPIQKLSIPRISFAALFAGLTLYLCTGFFISEKTLTYDSLSLMSGLAPPAYYNFFLPETEAKMVDPTIKSKYPSFTKCANNLDCFKDYYEGLAYANEVNKPVLLDFTGFGCVNCRKTEEHIWVEDKVWSKLDEDFILVSLYVDDRKKLETPLVSKATNEKLRTVGSKWADFQIVNFEQNSQPLYVMMAPDEEVLASPRGYHEGAEAYSEFLECGLTTYKNLDKRLGSK
jgi:thiol:disulfide interchange protein DsbD